MSTSAALISMVEQRVIDETVLIQAIEKTILSSGIDVATCRTVVDFIEITISQYSEVLSVPPGDVIQALECYRIKINQPAHLFYLDGSLPVLENLYIFGTLTDFHDAIRSGKYRCPSCNGESHSAYQCDSLKFNREHPEGIVCGSKNIALGSKILILSEFLFHPILYEMFTPVDIEHQPKKLLSEEDAFYDCYEDDDDDE